MSAIGRYYRTVKHLRPRQVWTRVVRRVVRPRPSSAPAPERRARAGTMVGPILRADGWVTPTRVRLLNIEREFPGVVDWQPLDMPRLWTYTLNYFQDLPGCVGNDPGERGGAPDSRQMSHLVGSWMAANPPGTSVTWDPYPISIRVLNWIKWILLNEQAGAPADGRVLDSLASQLRFLGKRIEFDIMANHLLANAVALTAGGLFFGGAEGDRWLADGSALLVREITEQIRDDGGHFERSPMYHAVVLEQLMDVLNLRTVFPASTTGELRHDLSDIVGEAVAAMLDWLAAMIHPDGELAFFHDTTLGASATYGELLDYSRRLRLLGGDMTLEPVHWLGESDFFRISSEDGRTVMFFDAGVPAPRYQPGHAHSESLSFELSRDARRIFVNSGISTYEPGPERLWERQTDAHNTVRIDKEEQSELWASHRCGRRPVLLHAGSLDGRPSAAHDGYHFLPGRPEHNRQVSLSDERVEIADTISGDGEHLLEWFFHLHPDVTATVRDRSVELSVDGRTIANISFPFGAAAMIERGHWHPGFNTAVPNMLIHVVLRASLPFEFITTIDWR